MSSPSQSGDIFRNTELRRRASRFDKLTCRIFPFITPNPHLVATMNEKASLAASQYSLLPCSSTAPSIKKSSKLSLPRLLALSSLALYLLYSSSSFLTSTLLASSEPDIVIDSSSVCFQPISPTLPKDQLTRSDVFWEDAFVKKEVERFLGAIRIPTETFDDMVDAPVDGEVSPHLT